MVLISENHIAFDTTFKNRRLRIRHNYSLFAVNY